MVSGAAVSTGAAQAPADQAYARYLAAKTTVDDRALSRPVLDRLRTLLPAGPPRVLEVGAGLGTMVARLIDWNVLDAGEYTLLDADAGLLAESRRWLAGWARQRNLPVRPRPDGLAVGGVQVRFVHAELADYLTGAAGTAGAGTGGADLLIANAVLDLVDLPAVLPALLAVLRPGGAYWLTINYDGESVFCPADPRDGQIMAAYHRDMDERVRYGRPAGTSRTGRALFGQLRAAGAPALAAGASDWVVQAGPDGRYPADEAHFTGAILATIAAALAGRPDRVAPADLAGWLAARQRQLAAGELVYVAHQLDFAGRWPGPAR